MKTLKILFAAFIIAGFATTTMADGPDTQGDNAVSVAKATILVGLDLSLDAGTNVDFGAVQMGSQPVLDPTDTDGDGAVEYQGIGDKNVARFSVTGANGATIKFSGDASISLSLEGEETSITFTPAFSYAEGSLSTDRGGSSYTLGDDVNLNETGLGTIWMGGNLGTVPTGLTAGEYTGDYTLSVEYN